MESLPNWLSAAVVAAGMTTAYADELDPKAIEQIAAPKSAAPLQEPPPPKH